MLSLPSTALKKFLWCHMKFAAAALTLTLLSTCAHATLIKRLEGRAYYDDVLDITWLADANWAKTSGFADANSFGGANSNVKSDGRLEYYTAVNWASTVVIDGYFGWRLPRVRPIEGFPFLSRNLYFSNDGSTNVGTSFAGSTTSGRGWITSDGSFGSELGYMFYENLGIPPVLCEPGGGGSTQSCIPPSNGIPIGEIQTGGPYLNANYSGPFVNILDDVPYWGDVPGNSNTFGFTFGTGYQHLANISSPSGVWLVRDGDVGPAVVPEPSTLYLIGTAFAGLGILRQKRTKQASRP